MVGLVRRYTKRLLGPKGAATLRAAQRRATGAYAILRGRTPSGPDTGFTAQDVDELGAGVRLFQRTESEAARDRLAVRLMNRVTLDVRYIELVQSAYLRADVPAPLDGLLAGAALFGGGRVEESFDTFKLTLDGHPSVRTFYCAARCASHGLLDHRRSAEIAQAGLHAFPESLLLTLVAAVGAYRSGDSSTANQLLESKHSEVRRTLAAAFPGITSLQAELDSALASGATDRETSYSNELIDRYWNMLFRNMECFNSFQHGWASMRWLQHSKLERALRGDASDVTMFLNFGAFCATVDAELAEQFPGIEFHGVDLGAQTKVLNEKAFRCRNLHFHDAFILDFLDRTPLSGRTTMLFHARTTTLFYPRFVEQFYQTCAAKGIRYLALWENNSLSYSTAWFYDFGSIPNGSVAYRDVMFIHDYKVLLEAAGYEILQEERAPSNRVLVEEDALAADGHVFVLARLR
ncbi:MAG: hypothetical protein H0T44_03125 [Gemmatimonadales bacterium]|nr:hypothetical protein [Gemmatimonadales bacterium]